MAITYPSIGLTVATESGFISAAAVVFLFGLILRNILRARRNPRWRFFKSPLDVYMLSLLFSDLVQSMGKILDIKWLNDGVIQCGNYCTAQGAVQQIGETSVAQATLAIAVHTFIIILFRKGHQAVGIAFLVVCAIWIYVILFVAISLAIHRNEHEYTPTPYCETMNQLSFLLANIYIGCWVSSEFPGDRLAGEYLWLWLTAFISLLLYLPLFFCLRGNIQSDSEKWWRIRFQRNRHAKRRSQQLAGPPTKASQESEAQRAAFVMLLYPASYVVLVLPISICRWIGTEKLPSAASFFGTSVLGLSGIVNVALLLFTRPGLLLLNSPAPRPISDLAHSVSASIASIPQGDGITRLRTLTAALNFVVDDEMDRPPDSRASDD